MSRDQLNELSGAPGMQLWQRDSYDHAIRKEVELNIIRQYIRTNPLRWAFIPHDEVDVSLLSRIEET